MTQEELISSDHRFGDRVRSSDRLVRAETLLLRELDFVGAAVAMGASDLRIVATHIVPNVLPQAATGASILAAAAIPAESSPLFVGSATLIE